jgi:hypothetical protein
LSDFGILWATKERKDGSFEKTINVTRVCKFLKVTGMLLCKPTPYKWII